MKNKDKFPDGKESRNYRVMVPDHRKGKEGKIVSYPCSFEPLYTRIEAISNLIKISKGLHRDDDDCWIEGPHERATLKDLKEWGEIK